MQGRQLTVSLLPNQIIDGGTFDHLRKNDNNPHVELGLFHSLAELLAPSHSTHDACGHVLPGANKDVSVSPPLSWVPTVPGLPQTCVPPGGRQQCEVPHFNSNSAEANFKSQRDSGIRSTFCFEDFPPPPLTLLVVASFCFCFCQFALSTCDTDSCSVPGSP